MSAGAQKDVDELDPNQTLVGMLGEDVGDWGWITLELQIYTGEKDKESGELVMKKIVIQDE